MSFTEEMARLHYKAGVWYFDVSNFSEALVEFKNAHDLEPKPALLYNMARCHESMDSAGSGNIVAAACRKPAGACVFG